MRRRWTDQEDLYVYRCVKSHLENMNKGFEEAAEALNRTKSSVSQRWYRYISKQDSTAFLLISETKSWRNRKMINSKTPKIKNKRTFWKKILKLLALD